MFCVVGVMWCLISGVDEMDCVEQIEFLYKKIYSRCVERYFANMGNDKAEVFKDIICICDGLKLCIKENDVYLENIKNKTENDVLSETIRKAYKFDKRKSVQRVDFYEWNPEENIYERLQKFCIDKDNKVIMPNDKILKIYGDFDKLLDKDLCVEDICCMVRNIYLRYKLNTIDCL